MLQFHLPMHYTKQSIYSRGLIAITPLYIIIYLVAVTKFQWDLVDFVVVAIR